jgi:glycosyltransferase involved in cell wall biosynthesis
MKPCVLIPTYNNARTLEAAVRGAQEQLDDVVVVDDGSTDDTAQILAGMTGITVLRHERNRGKGAALRTGFAHAVASGYTHAVTMDSDGQHVAAEIPRLLAGDESALVIGSRDLKASGGYRRSRFGLKNSNFWFWVATGLRVPDTQSGMRRYPLSSIDRLRLRTTGYDLEIEVMVKAAWIGVPIESVPIDVIYPPREERVSHMRPVLDFLRIGRLNARLVFLRICLPAPYLGIIARKRFYAMPIRHRIRESFQELFLREPGSPKRIALSVGLGLFMGLAPIWGFQIAATLLVAHWTGLSKPVAVVASHVSVPVFIPAILYASLLLGRLALGRYDPTIALDASDLPAWVVGSLILASATAIVGALITYVLVRCLKRG